MIDLLDTHQHLIYRDQAGYSWTKDIPPLAEGDFTVNDYKKITQDLNICGSLFMETGVDDKDYQKETHFIKSVMEDSASGIKGIIASIRPELDEDFDKWLEEALEINVCGFRRILHVMPNETSENSVFRNNVKKIGASGKPFDICYLPSQLSIALDFAKACEDMPLILNHCGVPSIAAGEIDPWRKDIKALSEMPNVICKLSGLMAYCAPGTSSYETIKPYVDHSLECFGPDRMVWGSDYPVVNAGKGIQEWIKVTHTILGNLSDDEAKKIASSNAERIYKI